jgi:hypothetical protein
MRFVAAIVLSCVGAACSGESDGDGNGDGGPGTQPTPTNRSPSITSISVSPTFGVVGLSQLTLAATATDPDNDVLTAQWTIGSQTLTGSHHTIPIPGDGPQTARLTVTDGRGGSVTDSRDFAAGLMTGTWRYSQTSCGNDFIVFSITQTGGTWSATATQVVSGTVCQAPPGATARTDPSEPATINAAGAVTARIKPPNASDVRMTGQMDTTGPTAGRRITGMIRQVTNSSNNDTFVMVKQ